MNAFNTTPANAKEWQYWDLGLGLGSNLLPCVPASPGVQVLEGSALAGKVGKIPSVFNREGFAHGIAGWQKKEILPNELALWSKDGRYNISVRTGQLSHVYAIDCDITDATVAQRVEELVRSVAGPLAVRGRANSAKMLIPLEVAGAYKKRVIETVHGRIEVLGDGQQFVACGIHASGARYEWRGDVQDGLPVRLPILTPEAFEGLCGRLAAEFGTKPARPAPVEVLGPSGAEQVLTTIDEDDWQRLRQALRFLLPKVADNDTWSEVGYALLSLKESRPACELWLDFSAKAAGYQPGAAEQWWGSHETQAPRSDWRHILKLARTHGWREVSDAQAFEPVTAEAVTPTAGETVQQDLLPPAPTRQIIRFTGGSLIENADSALQLLRPRVYVHSGKLVIVIRDAESKDGARRAASQPRLAILNEEMVRNELGRVATFQRRDERSQSWKAANCSTELARHLAAQAEWKHLRPLRAIVQHPFLREDGTICDEPGYDEASAALYEPNAQFPKLTETVSKNEALAALETVLEPFRQFPYATPETESAFVAHMLTEVARLAVDTAPMFWYSAPEAGTGKSLLGDMPATIAHGHVPSRRPWCESEEELRKGLTASLLAGDRSILLDNVPEGNKVRSNILSGFLTASIITDRRLGATENLRLANEAVISGSGNNITPSGDLARRSLVIRLDANMCRADLKKREFEIKNLPAYVAAHRVELLMALLTILRGCQQSGYVGPTPLPSFERWSELVRNAVLWLGMEDPVETQDEETDDGGGGFAEVFRLLVNTYGENPFGARDVASLAGLDSELATALSDAGRPECTDKTLVGFWLRDHRDRIGGDWKLIRAPQDSVHRVNRYCLRRVRGEHRAPAGQPLPPAANSDLA